MPPSGSRLGRSPAIASPVNVAGKRTTFEPALRRVTPEAVLAGVRTVLLGDGQGGEEDRVEHRQREGRRPPRVPRLVGVSLLVLAVAASALADRLELHHRSMGMSGDFELAVEVGSTIVRIGSALFGSRRS